MALPIDEDYKQKLHKHQVSATTSDGQQSPLQKDLITEPGDKMIPENQEEVKQHNTSTISTQTTEVCDIPIVPMADFQVVDVNDKLNLLMSAINKVNTTFHYKFDELHTILKDEKDGLVPKVKTIVKDVQELQARVDDMEGYTASLQMYKKKTETLEGLVNKLTDDVTLLKGLVQVQEMSIKENKKKVVDLTARSMANNIVITDIKGDSEEKKNCNEKIKDFLQNKLEISEDFLNFKVAHRLGNTITAKPRPIVVRCLHQLKEKALQNSYKLKDVQNFQGDYYGIRQQLPEPLHSEKIQREQHLRSIKKVNALIPEEDKHKRVNAYIKNKTLFVNKVAQKQHIFPPTVQEMFNITIQEQEELDAIQFEHTEAVNDKGSIFRAHALCVRSSKHIRKAYKCIKQLYPESNHIMLAYSVKTFTGSHDDSEYAASNRMLNILLNHTSADTAVFVMREYGGIHISPRCFLHIEKLTKDALKKLDPY